MKKIFLAALTIAICLLSFQAQAATKNSPTKKASSQPAVQLDAIAAVVNNDIITQEELSRQVGIVKQQLKQRNTPLPSDKSLRNQVLNNLIDVKLQLQIADRVGIQVDDLQVNQAISRIAQQNKMTVTQLKQRVEKQGLSYAEFRKQIRNELMVEQVQHQELQKSIVITPEEINHFIKSKRTQLENQTEYNLRDILIALPSTPTPAQVEAAQKQAKEVLAKIRKGSNFQTMAVSVSGGQQALKGGDLGWRTLAELPSIFAGKVATMKKDQVVGPIRAANGFHILKLVGTRMMHAKVDLGKDKKLREEVTQYLYNQKYQQALENWLQQLRANAFVKIEN